MVEQLTGAALGGVRIIDFSQYLAGPMAAMLLVDNGADVIRVDPPGGPKWDHPANAALQRGKRSITLDLHKAADVDIARQLIASADVVIEGFRPGVMRRWGLAPDDAVASHEGLIWCSLPGFGADDPRADMQAWEGVLCSAAGLYPKAAFRVTGGPRFTALPMASTFAAMIAAHSIAAALLARQRHGHGDHIEIPLFDACFEAISCYGETPTSLDQIEPKVPTAPISNPAFDVSRAYPCKDGRYLAQCGAPPRGMHRLWDQFLPTDLKDRTDQVAQQTAAEMLGALFAGRDAIEWERFCQEELGAAISACQTSAEWLDDDHARASGCVVETDDPFLGITRQPGLGVNLSRSAQSIRGPRKLPDSDRDAILAEIATARVQSTTALAERSQGLPLEGIRIVDFSNLLAGPIATRVLAEYGADVIKVNKSAIGLGSADPYTDDPIAFIGHRTTNAGKRTMFLDLKSEKGREIAAALVSSSDIVHVNFTAEAATRLGLDEQEIHAAHPGVIYSTLNLHSRGGWRSFERGHEDLAEAVTGLSLRYGGGIPEMHGIVLNDHATGHLAAFGIILALLERSQSGRGQTVETSLSRTATLHQMPYMIGFEGQIWDEPSGPDAKGWGPLDRLYETSHGWIFLAARESDALKRLSLVPDLEGLDECRLEVLESTLEERLKAHTAQEWEKRFLAGGISAQVYKDIADVMTDEISVARGLSITREHPGLGTGQGIGVVARFKSMPNRSVAPAAAPGWHTTAIVQEMGYGDRVDELRSAEVIV